MSKSNILHTAHKAHLIGIGGIGLSALARWLLALGKNVSGCDAIDSKIINDLISASIPIDVGHSPNHIIKSRPDIIIASPAVSNEDPEILEAVKNEIPVLSYPEALGILVNNLKTTAICGTNGKSTTTAIIGLIYAQGGLDPTVLVGSIVNEMNGNFRIGHSDAAVIEACEYKRAFLQYAPAVLIITNIEPEHLDYFKNLDDVISAFKEFALQIKKNGALIANGDDQNIEKVLREISASRPDIKIIRFGKSDNCDVKISAIKIDKEKIRFTVSFGNREDENFYLNIPGEFNVYNAAAALAAGWYHKVPADSAREVLKKFKGIRRRFERVGEYKGAIIISDYAHHPTAIEKTIQAARLFFPKKRLLAVFQPHQHNRTRMLFDDFVKCFDAADIVILTEIYKVLGRMSEEDKKISSNDLVRSIKDRDGERGVSREVIFAGDLPETEDLIKKHMRKNDCVLFMGAGDIGELPERFLLK